MTNLKNLKDTYRRRDILLPSVERHVLKKAKEPSGRRDDVMHPSEMAKSDWCGRHDFYRMTGVPVDFKGRSPSFRLENVFDYGHSVHSKYQRWLTEMGILWGKWACKKCAHVWTGPTPDYCENCESDSFRYKEVSLSNEELMISGHSDGIVLLDDSYKMIEIKTVGISTLRFEAYSLFDKYQSERLTPEELWFLIKRPFATHIRQGQIYLHLARSQYPELDIDEIIFIYEWKPTQEVKEFVVKYNPDLISQILSTAELVSDAVRNNDVDIVGRPEWAGKQGKTCSSCVYRNVCWEEGNENGESSDSENSSPRPSVRVKRSTSAKRGRVLRPKA